MNKYKQLKLFTPYTMSKLRTRKGNRVGTINTDLWLYLDSVRGIMSSIDKVGITLRNSTRNLPGIYQDLLAKSHYYLSVFVGDVQ